MSDSSSAMAARIQILHGELPSSFGFKEGELYVNNSGELYFGTENSSSAMVFGSKFSEINSLISGLESSKYTIGSEISLSCKINSSYPSGCHFEGEPIKLEHFSFPSGYTESNTIFNFEYSEYPSSNNLTLQGIYRKDSIIGKFTVNIGKTSVESFSEEMDLSVNNSFDRVKYIAKYGDPSKFWNVGECYFWSPIPLIIHVPITILGFNHDQVSTTKNGQELSEKEKYGKEYAGMTLMLGATRKISYENATYSRKYGILTPDNWHALLEEQDFNLIVNNSFRRINSRNTSGNESPTNWEGSLLRSKLNEESFLYNTLQPIKVQKKNNNCWQIDQLYTKSEITEDRIWLPSENEVFGTERFYTYNRNLPSIDYKIIPIKGDNNYQDRTTPAIFRNRFITSFSPSTSNGGTLCRGSDFDNVTVTINDYSKLFSFIQRWQNAYPNYKKMIDNYGYIVAKYNKTYQYFHFYYPGEPNITGTSKGLWSGAGDGQAPFRSTVNLSNITDYLGWTINNFPEQPSCDFSFLVVFPNSKVYDNSTIYQLAPGVEGEQYEFFKNIGSSKFFWSPDNQNATTTNPKITYIMLRSTINQTQGQYKFNNVCIYNRVTASMGEDSSKDSGITYGLKVAFDDDNNNILPCFCW